VTTHFLIIVTQVWVFSNNFCASIGGLGRKKKIFDNLPPMATENDPQLSTPQTKEALFGEYARGTFRGCYL